MSEALQAAEHTEPVLLEHPDDIESTPEEATPTNASISDSVETTPTSEQTYSHKHSGGQEFSGTIEQARRLCPALGRMSIENARATLQQDNLAARIAQRGREKRLAESAKTAELKQQFEAGERAKKVAPEKKPDRQPEEIRAREQSVRSDNLTIGADNGLVEQPANQPSESVLKAMASTTPEDNEHRPVTNSRLIVLEQQDLMARQVELEPEPAPESAKLLNITDRTSHEDIGRTRSAGLGVTFIAATYKQRNLIEVTEAGQAEAPPALDRLLSLATEENQDSYALAVESEPEESSQLETARNETAYSLFETDDITLPATASKETETDADEGYKLLVTEPVVTSANKTKQAQIASTESLIDITIPELPTQIEEIERAVTTLAAALESPATNTSPVINQIAERIAAMPDRLESDTHGIRETSKQELATLFIELFEAAGIKYTPELVTSFVALTQAHYLEKLLETPEIKEDVMRNSPHEIGTRELLQKLQHGLRAMKLAIVRFYEIGKSILRLYSLDNTAIRLT